MSGVGLKARWKLRSSQETAGGVLLPLREYPGGSVSKQIPYDRYFSLASRSAYDIQHSWSSLDIISGKRYPVTASDTPSPEALNDPLSSSPSSPFSTSPPMSVKRHRNSHTSETSYSPQRRVKKPKKTPRNMRTEGSPPTALWRKVGGCLSGLLGYVSKTTQSEGELSLSAWSTSSWAFLRSLIPLTP